AEPDAGGHDGGGERVERVVTERGEHLGGFGAARTDVAARERIGRCKNFELHRRTLARGYDGALVAVNAWNDALAASSVGLYRMSRSAMTPVSSRGAAPRTRW